MYLRDGVSAKEQSAVVPDEVTKLHQCDVNDVSWMLAERSSRSDWKRKSPPFDGRVSLACGNWHLVYSRHWFCDPVAGESRDDNCYLVSERRGRQGTDNPAKSGDPIATWHPARDLRKAERTRQYAGDEFVAEM